MNNPTYQDNATSHKPSNLPTKVWVAGGVMLVVISGLASALIFGGRSEDDASASSSMSSAVADGSATAPAARSTNLTAKRGLPVSSSKTVVAQVCANCGVVESVQAVQRKGQGTGLGAVAGGVLGGVVGHQMGGGNGKSAMTVLGAIGGGLAGNEVEKRQRADTVYNVQVRMDDGTMRSLTLPNAPASQGQRVEVDGQSVRVIASNR